MSAIPTALPEFCSGLTAPGMQALVRHEQLGLLASLNKECRILPWSGQHAPHVKKADGVMYFITGSQAQTALFFLRIWSTQEPRPQRMF